MSKGRSERAYAADLSWCYDAVEDVSRTFAITVDVLEEPMAERICVGYLLCRVADTIEDAGHIPPETQVELLQQYERTLRPDTEEAVAAFREAIDPWLPPAEDRSDDWHVVANVERVVATFESMPTEPREALRGPVRELVDGMATFVERYADTGGLRIGTIEELEEYCWYAAGTVGELITNLLTNDVEGQRAATLRENARSFALLLQLVNVAKDVTDDYHEENNVFLPAAWLEEVGVDQDQVCEPEHVPAVTRVISRVTDRAASYLDDAQAYLQAMPETQGNTLAAWAIPYLLAVGTIRELDARPEDVIERDGVKVPREEVLALLARFESGVERGAISDLRTIMSRQPLHTT
jgi:farnesyl-diphosphate farnesyltransferase